MPNKKPPIPADDLTRKALVAEARVRYAVILGDDVEIDDDALVSLIDADDDRADGYDRGAEEPTVRGWVQGWFYVDHVVISPEIPHIDEEQTIG